MSKQLRILLIILAGIVLLGAVGTWYVRKPSEHRVVEIVQEGTVIYTFDLEHTEDQEILLSSPNGSTNTVTIEDGTICISAAECPDQTCVEMGVLYSESLPIVCLPNQLIIRFR